MLIGKALLLRKKLERDLSEVIKDLGDSLVTKQGETVDELQPKPTELLERYETLSKTLDDLAAELIRANLNNYNQGQSIAFLRLSHDKIEQKISFYQNVANTLPKNSTRKGTNYVRILPTATRQKYVNELNPLREQLTNVDARIFEANWNAEIDWEPSYNLDGNSETDAALAALTVEELS